MKKYIERYKLFIYFFNKIDPQKMTTPIKWIEFCLGPPFGSFYGVYMILFFGYRFGIRWGNASDTCKGKVRKINVWNIIKFFGAILVVLCLLPVYFALFVIFCGNNLYRHWNK